MGVGRLAGTEHEMLNWKLVGSAAISAAAMSATLALIHDDEQVATAPGSESTPTDIVGHPARAAPESTLDAIMGLLDREVEERLRLQEQVDELSRRLALVEDTAAPPMPGAGRPTPPDADATDRDAPRELSEAALMQAGFSASEATYYRRRYDETAMAQLYLRDQAEREGWIGTPRYYDALREARAGLDSLRDEMGDEAYSRYLYALGRPNRVTIRRVIGGSAAEAAGLQPGDILLRYDGSRVYAVSDVRRGARQGQAGETVPVDILRGGNRIQAYLPRGPLGISMSSASVLAGDDS